MEQFALLSVIALAGLAASTNAQFTRTGTDGWACNVIITPGAETCVLNLDSFVQMRNQQAGFEGLDMSFTSPPTFSFYVYAPRGTLSKSDLQDKAGSLVEGWYNTLGCGDASWSFDCQPTARPKNTA